MTAKIGFFIIFIGLINADVLGQNDFSIRWNIYETGETIEVDPFAGGVTIKNEGESIILANDTIWYGYWIDGMPYDFGLNPGLVTGRVLDNDFLPGDEISITNNFYWPPLGSGITVEICAVVYGEGIASFEETYFLGDDNTINNTDCVYAILPLYGVSINEQANPEQFRCYFKAESLFITSDSNHGFENAKINILAINGKVVASFDTNLTSGLNEFNLSNVTSGVYFVSVLIDEKSYTFKCLR